MNSTSTNGWDTVYAIYFPDVNTAIRNQHSSPKDFAYTNPDNGDTLVGTFGDWQLAAGGDGANLHMSVPITTSTLTSTDVGKHQFDAPITLKIEVRLNWVSAAEDSTANRQSLTVKKTGDDTQPPVSIIKVDFGTNKVGTFVAGGYQLYALAYLTASPGVFKHVFSKINLNDTLDQNPGFQWMVPTSTLYAVVDKENAQGTEDFAHSLFAVLCMTENRPSPGVHEVDPYAIPDGTPEKPVNSAFLISPARVLSNMFLPGLPILFCDNPPLSSFDVEATTIKNNVDLQFADQELDNGHTVRPTIPAGNFVIQLVGNQIQFNMHGLYFDYTPGITVTIDHVSNSTLVLNSSRQFKMDVVGTPTTSASISVSKAVEITSIVTSVAAAVAGAAVGGFLGGVASGGAVAVAETGGTAAVEAVEATVAESAEDAVSNVTAEAVADAAAQAGGLAGKFANFIAANWTKMLGSFIGAAIGGSTSAIPGIIKKLASDNASEIPTLDAFGTQMMQPILWPDMAAEGDFLVSGQLNGALQMALSMKPVAPAAS